VIRGNFEIKKGQGHKRNVKKSFLAYIFVVHRSIHVKPISQNQKVSQTILDKLSIT